MKRSLGIVLAMGAAVGVARIVAEAQAGGEAASGQGGGVESCVSMNGDINASGEIDLSDAITVLGYLFLGSPMDLAPLCAAPDVADLQAQLAAAQADLAASQAQLEECRAGNCPPSSAGLPDTGQTICYNQSGAVINCTSATCPGQDGSYAASCPSEGRFTDNGDGTVTDNCTGLMWQKAHARISTWCSALSYCKDLSFAGHDDWRLPNVLELHSLIDFGRFEPAIDPVFGGSTGLHWSSTPYAGRSNAAWVVGFVGRYSGIDDMTDSYNVRAVRSVP